MSTLKEIKSRIRSVTSTRKITSAMKMVSSAKLRKSQKLIENFLPYEQQLNALLTNFLSADTETISPLAEERKIERVAIVVLTSNSSLCGAFNSNAIKELINTLEEYRTLGKENIFLYPIGKKGAKVLMKLGYEVTENFEELAAKPTYDVSAALAERLIKDFLDKKVDRIELIYHHFKSRSTQVLLHEVFLPISLKTSKENDSTHRVSLNYIVEPDRESILMELLPKVVKLKLFAAIADSSASEHAARTLAMQIATDNANDLLQELSLQYNKSRQQAITNELLDIVGGSFGME